MKMFYSKKWLPLGQGGYNNVFLCKEDGLVFKTIKNEKNELDAPERAVALWNRINPTLRPKAKEVTLLIEGMTYKG